jgi:FdhE protein
MDQALEKWIETHPYLLPVAHVQEIVARAAAAPSGSAPVVAGPPPEAYAAEHANAVPLLQSESATPDLAPAADALDRIVKALADATDIAHELRAEVRLLRDQLGDDRERRLEALRWLLAGAPTERAPAHAGLVRFLGWSALRAGLAPQLTAYDAWRASGDTWPHGHCPACGAQPAVARLSPGEVMRQRSLICACCGSEWRFRRIGCPHCGNDVSDRLSVLEVEGDDGLRIDACEDCKGYVKTYAGNDPRAVALADWTTLHLDLVARERGYMRLGASLVEI